MESENQVEDKKEEIAEFGNLIKGKETANLLQQNLKSEIEQLQTKSPSSSQQPCLGFVLVGSRDDSKLYVKMKKKA